MPNIVRVAIIDDHQSIIDGYIHRLDNIPGVQVIATGRNGQELESIMASQPIDVVFLDLSIPNSEENTDLYPILTNLPLLLSKYPAIKILVISMFKERSLVKAVLESGVCGYIFKDDRNSIQQLGHIVTLVANGGIYFSSSAYPDSPSEKSYILLTPRQLEAISICAAFPDLSSDVLALKLNISGSTFRNLLSGVYRRLDTHTRAAAIAKAKHLGLIPTENSHNMGDD